MEIAKFDYISFLDSDDLWLPNKLEEQINFMMDNQIAFSITNYEIITNDGNKTGKYIQSKTRNYKQLLRGNKVGCLTVMLDKRKLSDVKFKDIGHEDYALWLELLRSNNIKVYSIDKVLAIHRDTDNSLSSDKTKVIKWVWNIFRKEENKNVFFSIYLMIRYGLNYFNKTKRVIR